MSTIPHSALLLAVIGSTSPLLRPDMQIPDRPASRDHIKPRSKGYSLDGNPKTINANRPTMAERPRK
jgi:hypothetical protein